MVDKALPSGSLVGVLSPHEGGGTEAREMEGLPGGQCVTPSPSLIQGEAGKGAGRQWTWPSCQAPDPYATDPPTPLTPSPSPRAGPADTSRSLEARMHSRGRSNPAESLSLSMTGSCRACPWPQFPDAGGSEALGTHPLTVLSPWGVT